MMTRQLLGMLCVALLVAPAAVAGTALISGTDYTATDELLLVNPSLWTADSVNLSTDGETWTDYGGMAAGVGMADVIGNTTVGTLGTITMVLTEAVPTETYSWFDLSLTTGTYTDADRFMSTVINSTGVVVEFGNKVNGVSGGKIDIVTGTPGVIGVSVESDPANSKFIVSYTTNGTVWTPVDVTWASINALNVTQIGTVEASKAIRVKGPASYGWRWSAPPNEVLAQATLDEFLVESDDISGEFVFGPEEGAEGEGEGEGEPEPEGPQFSAECFWDKWGWWWGQTFAVAGNWDALPAAVGDGVTDLDGSGLPDRYDLAIFLGALATGCAKPGDNWVGVEDPAQSLQAAFEANMYALVGLADTFGTGWGGYWGHPVVLGMFATISQDWIDAINTQYPFTTGATLVPYGGGGKAGEPLSPTGDFDGDGISNADEVAAVLAGEWDVDQDALLVGQMAASFSGPYWPGNPALPVAGLVGLGLLAGASALGGVVVLIRKKR